MRYFDALEATVTLDEAAAELRRHDYGFTIRETDKALLDVETGDVIAIPDEFGEYAGEDIVGYLGY
ncbi:hypothetical protein FY136_28670 (plasmid) [Agrobacterium tumefaciens]|uniref:hypothetical protein n=1 Tax=Agrobacterium tumefaciens TaxID=358 RepID=UPI0021D2DEA0|nr:hypothetical protein [Agrobacterium tumefaciens]UXT53237.1 hypothetical protein FY136_28670 [Agrobacterium tumefaciens]